MRTVIQRIREGRVVVDGEVVGQAGRGLLILLGIRLGDTAKEAKFLAEKCVNLRIFEDADGKMNRSALDIGGQLLVVSQFTLYGDAQKGRRPSFIEAAPPVISEPLYKTFVDYLASYGLRTETGRFGAMMDVHLVNEGPVTIMIEKENERG